MGQVLDTILEKAVFLSKKAQKWDICPKKAGHLSIFRGTFVHFSRDICPPEIEIELEKEIETEIEFIFLLGAINCSQFILQAECFSLLFTDNIIRYLPTIYERMYQ